jgi:hypothetical protein
VNDGIVFHDHESVALSIMNVAYLSRIRFVPALSKLPILLVAGLVTIFFERFPETDRLSVSEHEIDTGLNIRV